MFTRTRLKLLSRSNLHNKVLWLLVLNFTGSPIHPPPLGALNPMMHVSDKTTSSKIDIYDTVFTNSRIIRFLIGGSTLNVEHNSSREPNNHFAIYIYNKKKDRNSLSRLKGKCAMGPFLPVLMINCSTHHLGLTILMWVRARSIEGNLKRSNPKELKQGPNMQLGVKWYNCEVCTFRYVAWVHYNVYSTCVWALTSFVEKSTFWPNLSHNANSGETMAKRYVSQT
jgi:hypothetical protein